MLRRRGRAVAVADGHHAEHVCHGVDLHREDARRVAGAVDVLLSLRVDPEVASLAHVGDWHGRGCAVRQCHCTRRRAHAHAGRVVAPRVSSPEWLRLAPRRVGCEEIPHSVVVHLEQADGHFERMRCLSGLTRLHHLRREIRRGGAEMAPDRARSCGGVPRRREISRDGVSMQLALRRASVRLPYAGGAASSRHRKLIPRALGGPIIVNVFPAATAGGGAA